MKRLFFGLIIFTLLHTAKAQTACSETNQQGELTLAEDLLLLAEYSDSITGQNSRALLTPYREMVHARDPNLLNALCELRRDYPSISSVVTRTRHQLQESWMVPSDKHLSLENKGAGTCFSVGQHEAIAGTLLALNLLEVVFQGYCDSLGCVEEVCGPVCLTVLPFVVITPTLEALLQNDAFTCFADHIGEMNAYSDTYLGFSLKGASSATLTEIASDITGQVTNLINTTDTNLGDRDRLSDTHTVISEVLDDTEQQLAGISDLAASDLHRRAQFQRYLEQLELESQLSTGEVEVSVSLRIPAAQGGSLNKVREVVSDAYANSIQAGFTVGSALDEIRAGDIQFNSGNFAAAFDHYRNAYQEIVQ